MLNLLTDAQKIIKICDISDVYIFAHINCRLKTVRKIRK